MKACEAQLFELREMEEMVEFMKNEVPNWEPSLLQVPRQSTPWAYCIQPRRRAPLRNQLLTQSRAVQIPALNPVLLPLLCRTF